MAVIAWLAIVIAVLAGALASAGRVQAQAMDPMEVFNAYHAAVNAHDVDAALALIAPDAVVQFPNQPPPNVFKGTQEIRTWLEADFAQHIQVVTENVQVTGERVTWIARVDVDDFRPLGITLVGTAEATIQEGKFTSFSYTLTDETLAKLAAIPAQPEALPRTGDASPMALWLLVIVGVGICGVGVALRRASV
jgi:hypothetical protein